MRVTTWSSSSPVPPLDRPPSFPQRAVQRARSVIWSTTSSRDSGRASQPPTAASRELGPHSLPPFIASWGSLAPANARGRPLSTLSQPQDTLLSLSPWRLPAATAFEALHSTWGSDGGPRHVPEWPRGVQLHVNVAFSLPSPDQRLPGPSRRPPPTLAQTRSSSSPKAHPPSPASEMFTADLGTTELASLYRTALDSDIGRSAEPRDRAAFDCHRDCSAGAGSRAPPHEPQSAKADAVEANRSPVPDRRHSRRWALSAPRTPFTRWRAGLISLCLGTPVSRRRLHPSSSTPRRSRPPCGRLPRSHRQCCPRHRSHRLQTRTRIRTRGPTPGTVPRARTAAMGPTRRRGTPATPALTRRRT